MLLGILCTFVVVPLWLTTLFVIHEVSFPDGSGLISRTISSAPAFLSGTFLAGTPDLLAIVLAGLLPGYIVLTLVDRAMAVRLVNKGICQWRPSNLQRRILSSSFINPLCGGFCVASVFSIPFTARFSDGLLWIVGINTFTSYIWTMYIVRQRLISNKLPFFGVWTLYMSLWALFELGLLWGTCSLADPEQGLHLFAENPVSFFIFLHLVGYTFLWAPILEISFYAFCFVTQLQDIDREACPAFRRIQDTWARRRLESPLLKHWSSPSLGLRAKFVGCVPGLHRGARIWPQNQNDGVDDSGHLIQVDMDTDLEKQG